MLELRRNEPGTEKRKEKIEMNIKEAQSASKGLQYASQSSLPAINNKMASFGNVRSSETSQGFLNAR